MKIVRFTRWHLVAAIVAVGAVFGMCQHGVAQEATGHQDGMEVLTRGPVHEAFAETVTFDPQPGVVAPKAPPEAIEEVAPDLRPEGDNVTWIPGYWSWDDERSNFLWVSGIWRALPPGRQWMPGYWAQSNQGSQWTSGYWANAQVNEIQYLPEPPATVEVGPNVAAPSADDSWIPGCWVWQENRYAWRPGSWVAGQQDWQWTPAYYVWTPRGYIFNDGYWDYSVARRGVVFAPVYFSGAAYTQRGFSYSPSTVINPAVFASHLFLRPSYGHYYFGDYYDSSYANAGFSPWFAIQANNLGYDPFFAQERWQNRGNRDWENRIQENFRGLRDNENIRPPRTWAAQTAINANAATSGNKAVVLAASLDELAQGKNSTFRFQPVDKTEGQQFGRQSQESRKFLAQRQQLEASTAKSPTADSSKAAGPTTAKLPKSPFAATTAAQLGKNDVSPKRYEVLKPNVDVEPQPRKVGGDAKMNTGVPAAADKSDPQTQPTKKPDNRPQGDAKGQKQIAPSGPQQGSTGGPPQGGAKGKDPSVTGGQPQSGAGVQQPGPAAGQQPRTAGGQEKGASPGQQKVNPQNQPPSDSTKKDKK